MGERMEVLVKSLPSLPCKSEYLDEELATS
jgi:hypothetical protein